MDTVLPQSMVKNGKDKQLHGIVQKYSNCEISREYQARTDF